MLGLKLIHNKLKIFHFLKFPSNFWPPGFDCRYYASSVLLESALITPAECVALGGNCCTWYGYGWGNDGLGSTCLKL